MRKIKMEIELEYNQITLHGDDADSIKWFYDDVLSKQADDLSLYSEDIGDLVGKVKILRRENPFDKSLIGEVNAVLEHLNAKVGRNYKDGKDILARLKEGNKIEELKKIIDVKIYDPYFQENPRYLCPSTLFRKSNFDKYRNQNIGDFKKVNYTGAVHKETGLCNYCDEGKRKDGENYCQVCIEMFTSQGDMNWGEEIRECIERNKK